MTTTSRTRPAAVAGTFYPADPEALRRQVHDYLDGAPDTPDAATPRALIAPHAGYDFSGPIAGSAYRQLGDAARNYRRVLVIGPSHRHPFAGLAVPDANAFETPLGSVPVDTEAVDAIQSACDDVVTLDAAHDREHGLEVHLPFLIETVGDFTLVP
ncbi:MAG: AmmeMemoRadiSam system protein B, partial [Phycisphaeraceae bacterium]|nr:AmmeMemoRadiSam system protein B [Phycisphaeraceae bacterium]